MNHRGHENRTVCTTKFLARLLPVLPLAFVASCMVGPDYKTPEARVEEAYVTAPAPTGKAVSATDDYWWKALADPVLDQLIETAYRNNLSLQAAGVSVLQARALLNESIGNLFPQQQGLSGAVDYSRLKTPSTGFPEGSFTSGVVTDQVLFSASWEIDFWGKYRRTIESDRAAFLGSVAAYDDALVTLIADVASTYISIRTTEERIRVANENVATQQESYRVARAQFTYGETSELDMRQAETVLAQTRAQIPQLQNSLAQSRNGLAVLLGLTPAELDSQLAPSIGIPVAPADVTAGIPRDLLRRRPDVREAGWAAASQSALIGVARANMYPALSLSGAFGFSSSNLGNESLGDIFQWQNRAVQGGGGLIWPLFNYGRLVNQVRVQDAAFELAVLNYQNTVLTAQQEVEDGLSAFYTGQQALGELLAAATAARRSTGLATVQYKSGEADYTTVLSTEQAQLSVEDSVATTQGSVIQGLISIYRALGGGWELRGDRDVISDDVKAEMARRTDWGRMLEPANHLPAPSAGE